MWVLFGLGFIWVLFVFLCGLEIVYSILGFHVVFHLGCVLGCIGSRFGPYVCYMWVRVGFSLSFILVSYWFLCLASGWI